MKRIVLFFAATLMLAGCKEKKETAEEPEAADMVEEMAPAASDWIVLFDGSSFDGWKGYNQEGIPETWKLEDGAMVLVPPAEKPEGANYNLVTTETFHNFVLSLEWKISEGGNSGVFWGVEELEEFGEPYETGPEVQVLDNGGHPDAQNGTSHQAGALYDMVSPSEDVTRPVGEWNTMELTIDYANEQGKVVLNGTEIVSFPLGNEAWDTMVANSKFNGWPGFGKYPNGKIGLQDHGNEVAFRNIKIKPLP